MTSSQLEFSWDGRACGWVKAEVEAEAEEGSVFAATASLFPLLAEEGRASSRVLDWSTAWKAVVSGPDQLFQ